MCMCMLGLGFGIGWVGRLISIEGRYLILFPSARRWVRVHFVGGSRFFSGGCCEVFLFCFFACGLMLMRSFLVREGRIF